MGHDRVNALPRTKPWRVVLSDLVKFNKNKIDIEQLSSDTLKNVRNRFENIAKDKGVNAAFSFLLTLAVAAKDEKNVRGLSKLGINVSLNASPLQLTKILKEWVDQNIESSEYGELAKGATSDTIISWYRKFEDGQENLFGEKVENADKWRRASDGSGFCELSRLFFSKFTERYLKYFLDREASDKIFSYEDRERLDKELKEHLNVVSKYAFETAKITQSFAAGWYNKNTKEDLPSDRAIRGFLLHAFEKMREELQRQGKSK